LAVASRGGKGVWDCPQAEAWGWGLAAASREARLRGLDRASPEVACGRIARLPPGSRDRRASEAGVDIERSLITITQYAADEAYWRVNYGPREMNLRGGDFIVDVDARDASIKRVLLGQ
jgi:hypothetical protein